MWGDLDDDSKYWVGEVLVPSIGGRGGSGGPAVEWKPKRKRAGTRRGPNVLKTPRAEVRIFF